MSDSNQKSSSYAIEVTELSHRYQKNSAVNKISFSVPQGSIFGLIGSNGAGKSTTIKMLTTLLPITSGKAWINGFDVTQQPEKVRQSIGYVPQQLSANSELTGYENLMLSAKLYGLSHENRNQRVEEVLNFMNLNGVRNKLVSEYSGGMIRCLEIGQALIHRPPVLFLDEPTIGLDPAARKVIWRYLQTLNKQYGTAILMTTHDMEEVDVLCDTIALVHAGKMVVMDTPAKLKEKIGSKATLDDVFILHTGSSLNETEEHFDSVRQARTAITSL